MLCRAAFYRLKAFLQEPDCLLDLGLCQAVQDQ
jgi:hypothetical protein